MQAEKSYFDHWLHVSKNSSALWFYSHCFHDFIHVNSPWAGADNPLGPQFWCQQEGLVTMVICCKFKKNLFNLWLYIHLIMPQVRGRPPKGTKLWCQQKPLVTSVICYKIQKNLFEVWFHTYIYIFFPDFIHVKKCIKSGRGWQQEHLVILVICCKFKRSLFEVWFYTNFHDFIHVYSPGQGQTTPGDKVLMSTEMSCHFIHLMEVLKKCRWSLILYMFFFSSWFNTCI